MQREANGIILASVGEAVNASGLLVSTTTTAASAIAGNSPL